MGYAPTPDAPGAAAFADFDNGPLDDANDWTIWASAFGGSTTTDGDALVGSHERTIQDAGIAIGFDRQVSPDTLVGCSAFLWSHVVLAVR